MRSGLEEVMQVQGLGQAAIFSMVRDRKLARHTYSGYRYYILLRTR